MIRRVQVRAVISSMWFGYIAAIAAVGIVTASIGWVVGRVPMANASMLYLIAVLATAVAYGSGPAVLASFVAFFAFDWFFVEPIDTIVVANPGEWTSLLLFLLTAIVTGQLAADQRRQAREAREREREAVVLSDVVRLMLEDADLDRALRAVASRLRFELGLAAVAIELPGADTPAVAVGNPAGLDLIQGGRHAASISLSAGERPTAELRGRPGTWSALGPSRVSASHGSGNLGPLHEVPFVGPHGQRGTLFLVPEPRDVPFGPGEDRLLSAVAAQLGLALERAHLRKEATDAEVLRRTDELRKALLNAVSHDLRTPLASIIAAAGSLAEDDVTWSREDVRAFGHDIEGEALRLNRIVSNLLDLSRIQAGAVVPRKGWYDLGALIDDAVGRLRSANRQRRVTVDVASDLSPVFLDYVELDQVLTNLLDNAVKYSSAETSIEVVARREADVIRVEVDDRGPGLAAEALGRVFEPFFRASDRAGQRGTGLGLAVARGLVEAHGGRIWAENRVGGGARFVFILPRVDAADPTLAANEVAG